MSDCGYHHIGLTSTCRLCLSETMAAGARDEVRKATKALKCQVESLQKELSNRLHANVNAKLTKQVLDLEGQVEATGKAITALRACYKWDRQEYQNNPRLVQAVKEALDELDRHSTKETGACKEHGEVGCADCFAKALEKAGEVFKREHLNEPSVAPGHGHEFTWCRQELAEDCKKDGSHCHIVIASPGGRQIMPSCKSPTLHLFFHDLVPSEIRSTDAFAANPVKGQELIDQCFNETHAAQIIQFVKSTGSDEPIVVNCEAGVSRSPAVVAALRRFQGEETDSVFKRTHPNIHVASVLGVMLGDGPFEKPIYGKKIVEFFSQPLKKKGNQS